MAKIRSAKREWWSKEKWCRLPRDVRFTYKGIWEVMADDEGRFQADARLIKADVWPLDDDITVKKIEAWLVKLAGVMVTSRSGERVPSIQLYEVDGVRYGFLAGFVKHQKISHELPSKIPAPPEQFRSSSGNEPEMNRQRPENFSPDTDTDLDRDLDIDLDTDSDAKPEVVGKDATVRFVVAANTGLAEHVDPARRQIEPLSVNSASSKDATAAIMAAGVPVDFAEAEISRVARICEPDGKVKSLRYFVPGVTRAWEDRDRPRVSRRPANASRFAPPSDTTKAIIADMIAGKS